MDPLQRNNKNVNDRKIEKIIQFYNAVLGTMNKGETLYQNRNQYLTIGDVMIFYNQCKPKVDTYYTKYVIPAYINKTAKQMEDVNFWQKLTRYIKHSYQTAQSYSNFNQKFAQVNQQIKKRQLLITQNQFMTKQKIQRLHQLFKILMKGDADNYIGFKQEYRKIFNMEWIDALMKPFQQDYIILRDVQARLKAFCVKNYSNTCKTEGSLSDKCLHHISHIQSRTPPNQSPLQKPLIQCSPSKPILRTPCLNPNPKSNQPQCQAQAQPQPQAYAGLFSILPRCNKLQKYLLTESSSCQHNKLNIDRNIKVDRCIYCFKCDQYKRQHKIPIDMLQVMQNAINRLNVIYKKLQQVLNVDVDAIFKQKGEKKQTNKEWNWDITEKMECWVQAVKHEISKKYNQLHFEIMKQYSQANPNLKNLFSIYETWQKNQKKVKQTIQLQPQPQMIQNPQINPNNRNSPSPRPISHNQQSLIQMKIKQQLIQQLQLILQEYNYKKQNFIGDYINRWQDRKNRKNRRTGRDGSQPWAQKQDKDQTNVKFWVMVVDQVCEAVETLYKLPPHLDIFTCIAKLTLFANIHLQCKNYCKNFSSINKTTGPISQMIPPIEQTLKKLFGQQCQSKIPQARHQKQNQKQFQQVNSKNMKQMVMAEGGTCNRFGNAEVQHPQSYKQGSIVQFGGQNIDINVLFQSVNMQNERLRQINQQFSAIILYQKNRIQQLESNQPAYNQQVLFRGVMAYSQQKQKKLQTQYQKCDKQKKEVQYFKNQLHTVTKQHLSLKQVYSQLKDKYTFIEGQLVGVRAKLERDREEANAQAGKLREERNKAVNFYRNIRRLFGMEEEGNGQEDKIQQNQNRDQKYQLNMHSSQEKLTLSEVSNKIEAIIKEYKMCQQFTEKIWNKIINTKQQQQSKQCQQASSNLLSQYKQFRFGQPNQPELLSKQQYILQKLSIQPLSPSSNLQPILLCPPPPPPQSQPSSRPSLPQKAADRKPSILQPMRRQQVQAVKVPEGTKNVSSEKRSVNDLMIQNDKFKKGIETLKRENANLKKKLEILENGEEGNKGVTGIGLKKKNNSAQKVTLGRNMKAMPQINVVQQVAKLKNDLQKQRTKNSQAKQVIEQQKRNNQKLKSKIRLLQSELQLQKENNKKNNEEQQNNPQKKKSNQYPDQQGANQAAYQQKLKQQTEKLTIQWQQKIRVIQQKNANLRNTLAALQIQLSQQMDKVTQYEDKQKQLLKNEPKRGNLPSSKVIPGKAEKQKLQKQLDQLRALIKQMDTKKDRLNKESNEALARNFKLLEKQKKTKACLQEIEKKLAESQQKSKKIQDCQKCVKLQFHIEQLYRNSNAQKIKGQQEQIY